MNGIPEELLEALSGGHSHTGGEEPAYTRFPTGLKLESTVAQLREVHEILDQNELLQLGDVVVWKSPMVKTHRMAGPFLVMELLDEPVRELCTEGSGSPHWNTPMDIRLAFMAEEGTPVTHCYEKRFFKKYIPAG